MVDDDYPSDYDVEDLEPTSKSVAVDLEEDDEAIRDALKRELLLLASVTNRGEFASPEEKDIIVDLVTQLEVRTLLLSSLSCCIVFLTMILCVYTSRH